jgi:hypothetical protein
MPEDLDDILASLVNKKGKCKTCGHDHRFTPDLQDVKTSFDIICELSSLQDDKPQEILRRYV